MRKRQLGSSDLMVSEISLGSWMTYGGAVSRDRSEACVAKAFELLVAQHLRRTRERS